MQLYNKYYVSENSQFINPCGASTIEFIPKGCDLYTCVFSTKNKKIVGLASLAKGPVNNVFIEFNLPINAKALLNFERKKGTLTFYAPGKKPKNYYINYMPTYF